MAKAPAKRPYIRRNMATATADPVTPFSKVDLTNPVAMRARIQEINELAAQLHAEKTMLEKCISDLGFQMTGVGNADPDNWHEGMAIRCIKEDGAALTEGKLYIISSTSRKDCVEVIDDDGDAVYYERNLFQFAAA